MRYFLELSFDGTPFHGWQKQPNALAVQAVLEDCISKLLHTPTSLMGAGRTDTGVHARQMFAHFDSETVLDADWIYRLNAFLPASIAVSNLFRMQPTAHARFDALQRGYVYRIHCTKNPFLVNRSWLIRQRLHQEKMQQASDLLLSAKDFASFARLHSDNKTTLCDVRKAKWQKTAEGYEFVVEADRFLRNMVRALVGTLVDVGKEKISISEFESILQAKDRTCAAASAPAAGLYLNQVVYPKSLFA